MISWAGNLRVYLATGVTDMRKSIDTLAVQVSERLDMDPLSGHLFGFCNRKRDTIKILYWDRNGFCLWHKRLERDRFHWPECESEARLISARELAWLLDGLAIKQAAHRTIRYEKIC
jgi:transposase